MKRLAPKLRVICACTSTEGIDKDVPVYVSTKEGSLGKLTSFHVDAVPYPGANFTGLAWIGESGDCLVDVEVPYNACFSKPMEIKLTDLQINES